MHEAEIDRAHVSKIEREMTYVGIEIIGKFVDEQLYGHTWVLVTINDATSISRFVEQAG